MKDNFKAIGIWAVCLVAVNILAVVLVYLSALISDTFHLTMPGLPSTGPQPLSEQFFLGLAGFLALFNVFMMSILILLLLWLVGSVVVLLVSALRNTYFKQKPTKRV
jgi:hypothetical protein